MRNVISFCDARAARLKQSLSTLAARREGAIVRGRGEEPICARRIFCRDQGVVLIDRYGFQSHLGYDDILDAVPMERVAPKAPALVSPLKEIASPPTEKPAGADHVSADSIIGSGNVIAFRRRDSEGLPAS